MNKEEEKQSKLSAAKSNGYEVVITKNDGSNVQGKPSIAESDGSPNWYIEDKEGNGEWVNLNDIKEVSIVEKDLGEE